MEDQHRWRDQVELSLDNRQIFLLFSAAAVVVSLVFALGVVVGKRLQRDGSDAQRTDPLALLDQLSGTAVADEGTLTFPQALMEGEASSDGPREKSAPKPSDATRAVSGRAARDRDTPVNRQNAVAKRQDEAKSDRPAKVAAAAPPQRAGRTAKGDSGSARDEQREETGEYTLQLSSFQDRLEAQQFTQKLIKAGLKPKLRPTEIPGRGMWYRVRLGQYSSWDKALLAKQNFEREHEVIAYVARD